MTLYSSHEIIIQRVRISVILILINAMIKTVGLWIIIVFFANRLLANPLRQFTRQIGAFNPAEANHAPHIDPGQVRSAELVYLCDTFNDLTERMVASKHELRQLASSFEQRVQERTTELKHTQQQLAFQEKMASIGTLTAGVAHEINNPANFAPVGAQVLETDLERFRQFFLELTDDPGSEILDSLNQRISANPVLECWPAQLNQVFMNLIVNACHAIQAKQRQTGIPAPGTLRIRSRIEDNWLVFEFEDSGCGISPGVIDRIFEPFFTTKNIGEGAGLGLSISFSIIERHCGDIQVRSQEGEGSCFTVRLPLERREEFAALGLGSEA